MALIPLGSGRFADDPDTRRGVTVMRYQNSVFHGLLKHLPWGEFDRLVAVHGADSRVRRLTTKSQFVALLYGQLAGAASLREISRVCKAIGRGCTISARGRCSARPWPMPMRTARPRFSASGSRGWSAAPTGICAGRWAIRFI